jgi:hypothetical protein
MKAARSTGGFNDAANGETTIRVLSMRMRVLEHASADTANYIRDWQDKRTV